MRGIMLGLALLAFPSVASAQGAKCGIIADIAEQLMADHGEAPMFEGVTERGARVVFYVNQTSGSWTLVTEHGEPQMIDGQRVVPTCYAGGGRFMPVIAPPRVPKGTKS